jgi:hypothetical protein
MENEFMRINVSAQTGSQYWTMRLMDDIAHLRWYLCRPSQYRLNDKIPVSALTLPSLHFLISFQSQNHQSAQTKHAPYPETYQQAANSPVHPT